MSTGQMLVTVAAMVLLSLLVLRISSTSAITQESMQNSKFGVLATSLASSILEEAGGKFFDEATNGVFVTNLNDLTPSGSFGVEGGEDADSILTFDDFDDFNGYTRTLSDMPSAVFTVNCQVSYVDPDLGGFVTANRTWHKMLTISVSSPSINSGPLVFRKVFSYWKFL